MPRNFSGFCSVCRADKDGKITVPIATPIRPSGNSVIRSALYSQDTEPSCMNEAQMVFNSRLICVTDTPNNAGSINFMMRSTPSCLKSIFGGISRFLRHNSGIWIASCKIPAMITAQPSAIIGSAIYGVSQSAPAIIATFSKTGANAGVLKEP